MKFVDDDDDDDDDDFASRKNPKISTIQFSLYAIPQNGLVQKRITPHDT